MGNAPWVLLETLKTLMEKVLDLGEVYVLEGKDMCELCFQRQKDAFRCGSYLMTAIRSYIVCCSYIKDVTYLFYSAYVTQVIRDGCTSMYINAVLENYYGSPNSLRDEEVFR